MKRFLSVLLSLCLVFSAAACGSAGAGSSAAEETEDPNEGKYYLVFSSGSVTDPGEEYLRLDSDREMKLVLGGESLTGKWRLSDGTLTLTLDGEKIKGTLDDGVVEIELNGRNDIFVMGKKAAQAYADRLRESYASGAQETRTAAEEPAPATSWRLSRMSVTSYPSFGEEQFCAITAYNEEGLAESMRPNGDDAEIRFAFAFGDDGYLARITPVLPEGAEEDMFNYTEIRLENTVSDGELTECVLHLYGTENSPEYAGESLDEHLAGLESISVNVYSLLSAFLQIVENYTAFRNTEVRLAGTDFCLRYENGRLVCNYQDFSLLQGKGSYYVTKTEYHADGSYDQTTETLVGNVFNSQTFCFDADGVPVRMQVKTSSSVTACYEFCREASVDEYGEACEEGLVASQSFEEGQAGENLKGQRLFRVYLYADGSLKTLEWYLASRDYPNYAAFYENGNCVCTKSYYPGSEELNTITEYEYVPVP